MGFMEKSLNKLCFRLVAASCLVIMNSKVGLGQSLDSSMNDLLIEYIQKDKEEGNEFVNQYTVYLLYVYKIDTSNQEFCFTIGLLLNASDYKRYHYNVNHYRKIGDDYVLLKLGDEVKEADDFANEIGFVPLLQETRIKVVQKLFPSIPLSGFTYRQSPIAGCYQGLEFSYKQYQPDEVLPDKYQEL